jgi:hypothetical protein
MCLPLTRSPGATAQVHSARLWRMIGKRHAHSFNNFVETQPGALAERLHGRGLIPTYLPHCNSRNVKVLPDCRAGSQTPHHC